jgi:hypothetical protein
MAFRAHIGTNVLRRYCELYTDRKYKINLYIFLQLFMTVFINSVIVILLYIYNVKSLSVAQHKISILAILQP